MIPVWTEPTSTRNEFPKIIEQCVFCDTPTRTWHENTNNPICVNCASIRKVSEIPEDYGSRVRHNKLVGKFDREDSVRAN